MRETNICLKHYSIGNHHNSIETTIRADCREQFNWLNEYKKVPSIVNYANKINYRYFQLFFQKELILLEFFIFFSLSLRFK